MLLHGISRAAIAMIVLFGAIGGVYGQLLIRPTNVAQDQNYDWTFRNTLNIGSPGVGAGGFRIFSPYIEWEDVGNSAWMQATGTGWSLSGALSIENSFQTRVNLGVPGGTGTAGRLARWIDANTIGESVIRVDDSTAAIGGVPVTGRQLVTYGLHQNGIRIQTPQSTDLDFYSTSAGVADANRNWRIRTNNNGWGLLQILRSAAPNSDPTIHTLTMNNVGWMRLGSWAVPTAMLDVGGSVVASGSGTFGQMQLNVGHVQGLNIISTASPIIDLTSTKSITQGRNFRIVNSWNIDGQLQILRSTSQGGSPITPMVNFDGSNGWMRLGTYAIPTAMLDVGGNISVSGGVTPSLTAIHDLGSTGNRWRDGWFSRNLHGQSISVTQQIDTPVVYSGSDLSVGTEWGDLSLFGDTVSIYSPNMVEIQAPLSTGGITTGTDTSTFNGPVQFNDILNTVGANFAGVLDIASATFDGIFTPVTTLVNDIGTASARWRNIFAKNLNLATTGGHITGNQDIRGTISLGAGIDEATVTFNRSYASTPYVVVTPREYNPWKFWVTTSVSGFTLTMEDADQSAYSFNYMVME